MVVDRSRQYGKRVWQTSHVCWGFTSQTRSQKKLSIQLGRDDSQTLSCSPCKFNIRVSSSPPLRAFKPFNAHLQVDYPSYTVVICQQNEIEAFADFLIRFTLNIQSYEARAYCCHDK